VITHTYDTQGLRISTMDRNFNLTQWQYHADGTRANQVVDPGGLELITSYQYDSAGRLLEQATFRNSDLSDRIVERMAYDALGRQIAETVDPDGLNLTTQYDYDAAGRIARQTNPRGVDTVYDYNAGGQLQRETLDPGGLQLTTEYLYDKRGNRTTRIDPEGHETRFEYDSRDRLTKEIDAEGYWTLYEYDLQGNRTAVRRSLNPGTGPYHVTHYRYDALGRRTHEIVDPFGLALTTVYEYALAGATGCACGTPGSALVHKSVDPAGKITFRYYDPLDRLTHEVQKVGDSEDNGGDDNDLIQRYTYDAVGNLIRTTVENAPYSDAVSTRRYDAANRLVEAVDAPTGTGRHTQRVYDGTGNIIRITTALDNSIAREFDQANRLSRETDAIGTTAAFTYDRNGNILTRVDSLGRVWKYTYDRADRLVAVYDPLEELPVDKHTTRAYDGNGNLVRETDNEGLVSAFTYDALGRLIREIRNHGDSSTTTSLQYDSRGNVTAVTDDNGNVTRHQYDPASRRIREIFADDTEIRYLYDAAGNLIRLTDQMGNVTLYTYNDLHRLTERNYGNGAVDTFSYDMLGNLLSASNVDSHIRYAFDDIGRIVSSTQTDRPETYSHEVRFEYNFQPNQRTLHYPGGTTVREVRDVRDRIVSVYRDGVESTTYAYNDPANQMIRRSHANGTQTTYRYNANAWLDEVYHLNTDQAILAGFAYSYDGVGNRIQAVNRQQTIAVDSAKAVTHSMRYEYDSLHRLVGFRRGLGQGDIPNPADQRRWMLDGTGNWENVTINGLTYSNTVNQMNEYDDPSSNGPGPIPDDDGLANDVRVIGAEGRNQSHDKNGNLVASGQHRYHYDNDHRPINQATLRASNRLTLVRDHDSGSVLGEYVYDALGRRIQKVNGSVTTVYVYTPGWRVVEEYENQALSADYTYGHYIDEVLTMSRDSKTYYYHQDGAWSVIAVTDGQGQVVERYAYDPYGTPLYADAQGTPLEAGQTLAGRIQNPYLFTGRRLDPESNLYHFRWRQYQPENGRFTSRDPLFAVNLYQYAESRPVIGVDPAGLHTNWTAKAWQKVWDVDYSISLVALPSSKDYERVESQSLVVHAELTAKYGPHDNPGATPGILYLDANTDADPTKRTGVKRTDDSREREVWKQKTANSFVIASAPKAPYCVQCLDFKWVAEIEAIEKETLTEKYAPQAATELLDKAGLGKLVSPAVKAGIFGPTTPAKVRGFPTFRLRVCADGTKVMRIDNGIDGWRTRDVNAFVSLGRFVGFSGNPARIPGSAFSAQTGVE